MERNGVSESAQNALKQAFKLIFREKLTVSNALTHAKASRIDVNYDVGRDDTLHLRISDDGVGFHLKEVFDTPSGLGLAMIRERIESIGGRTDIVSDPDQGTVISLIVTLESQSVSMDRNHTTPKGSATVATQTGNTSPWGLFD